ncbi:hypothetical protein [Streptomyces sp. NBC_01723]|uniref:hypothetical protein n=1 Tax=Streptomyces sp. NBC_01723 TaxID=2975921 RepID=UPI003FCD22F5
MTRLRPYPSDLSDARWESIGPTLTAWRAQRKGKVLDIGSPPSMPSPHHGRRSHRDPLALPAARHRTVGDGLRLLRRLAEERRLHPSQRPAATPGS